jgi:hypothetical protein
MLFSRHAGNDNLESFSKATHSLAISLKSLESLCTLLLLSAREQTSGRSLARLAVRCHDICGDDTARHKSCYYRWRWWNAVQSLPRRARENERVLFSSHAICYSIIMVTRLTCIAAVLEEPNYYYQIPPLSNVTILLSRHVFFPLPSILL